MANTDAETRPPVEGAIGDPTNSTGWAVVRTATDEMVALRAEADPPLTEGQDFPTGEA